MKVFLFLLSHEQSKTKQNKQNQNKHKLKTTMTSNNFKNVKLTLYLELFSSLQKRYKSKCKECPFNFYPDALAFNILSHLLVCLPISVSFSEPFEEELHILWCFDPKYFSVYFPHTRVGIFC